MYNELVKKMRQQCIDMNCGNCNTCLNGKAADAIEELSVVMRAQKAVLDKFPRWIPVTERLPQQQEKVILAIKDETGDTAFSYTYTGWYSGYGYRFVVDDDYCSWVTHWMPLPEPPKEES